MRRTDSLEKTLMLGKIEGRRIRGQQRMRWLDGITDWMDMGLSKLRKMVRNREAWHAAVHGVTKNLTWLSDWTDCSPPGFCVHRILQARILDWFTISFLRGSSWTRDQFPVSCIAGKWALAQFLEFPHHFLQIVRILLPLINLGNWQPHTLRLLWPSEMAHTLFVNMFLSK